MIRFVWVGPEDDFTVARQNDRAVPGYLANESCISLTPLRRRNCLVFKIVELRGNQLN